MDAVVKPLPRPVPSLPEQLRQAGLRPSIARIGVLQLMAASASALTVDEVYHQMLLRGTRTSLGTVYRTVQQLAAAGLLLRDWDTARRSRYRHPAALAPAAALRLVCEDSGVSIELQDEALHALLLAVAERGGVRLEGRPLEIHAGPRR